MTASPAPSISRRHDLDALRAFAMLLGIAVHGALSFVPMPSEDGWPVRDVNQHAAFAWMLGAVHGFRMPLFIAAQWFVRDWTLPAVIKFVALSGVVSGALLVVYQVAVRYTVIGASLNGPKQRPRKRAEVQPESGTEEVSIAAGTLPSTAAERRH